MEKIIRSSELKNTPRIESYLNELFRSLNGREGTIYHKYPIVSAGNGYTPDISVVLPEFGIVLIHISKYRVSECDSIGEDIWVCNKNEEDSPKILLEDCAQSIISRVNKHRAIRNKFQIIPVVCFPNDTKDAFERKFGSPEGCIFGEPNERTILDLFRHELIPIEAEQKLFLSAIQGVGPLNANKKIAVEEKSDVIGKAIKLLDSQISLLDRTQQKAALQIPDGPQRIRGMAGTGKTVILAMKAANLHSHYPDKKILYTFYTQALYSQVRNLITKFYRENEDKDPNWDNLLVLHSWGGRAKEGVYYRACLRNSVMPRNLRNVPFVDDPLDHVCTELLKSKLEEEYDFVLMDEAQDFPPSFFQMIYKLTKEPKRIIFAYDEMQSLEKIQIRDTRELFGVNPDGSSVVDFSPGTYYGDIEMDYVLDISYRNPLNLLMTAHAIGLGLYSDDGYMQIIDDSSTWKAIGYDIKSGELSPRSRLEIYRSPEKSLSLSERVYSGGRPPLEYFQFDDLDQELEYLAKRIKDDVSVEGVAEHQIVVVSLGKKAAKNQFPKLQRLLHQKGVPSIIPGEGGVDRDKFGENGFVTLATVHKAKGNESFIVYVMNFEYLYDYVDFIQSRNKAFTSLTRAKGWCTITGVGPLMRRAIEEIQRIERELPWFRFDFPEPNKVKRRLSQEEHARRLQDVKSVQEATKDLLSVDANALSTLPKEVITELLERLGRVSK